MTALGATDKEVHLANQICDQCFTRRSQCTRELPKCSRCLINDSTCSYLRLTRRRENQLKCPELTQSQQFFSIAERRFFPRPNRKKSSVKPSKEKVQTIRKEKDFNNKQELNFTQLKSFSDLDVLRIQILKHFHLRSIYRLLNSMTGMNLFQPNLMMPTEVDTIRFTPLLKTSVVLFQEAGLVFAQSSLKTKPSPAGEVNRMLRQFQFCNLQYSVLDQATKTYFNKVHPSCPLFIQSKFDIWDRPILLRLSIWSAGLSFLPSTCLIQELMDIIHRLLVAKISSFHLPPTLSTLQALIVIQMGTKEYSELNRLTLSRFELLIPMVIQLGLHRPYKRLDLIVQLERKLALIGACFHVASRTFGYNRPPLGYFVTHDRHFHLIKLATHLLKHNPAELSLIIFAQSASYTIIALHHLYLLRESSPSSSIANSIKQCYQLESWITIQFSLLNQLIQQQVQFDSYLMLSLNIRYHSLLHYMYTTLFNLSRQSLHLNKSLTSAHNIITSVLLLPRSRLTYIELGGIAYAITWLVAHEAHSPLINQAYNLLTKVRAQPGIKSTSQLLAGLCGFVIKFYCSG